MTLSMPSVHYNAQLETLTVTVVIDGVTSVLEQPLTLEQSAIFTNTDLVNFISGELPPGTYQPVVGCLLATFVAAVVASESEIQ